MAKSVGVAIVVMFKRSSVVLLATTGNCVVFVKSVSESRASLDEGLPTYLPKYMMLTRREGKAE